MSFSEAILTAAMEMLAGQGEAAAMSRKPDIMADAAYTILTKDSGSFTGNFAIDDDVLADVGVKSFDHYAVDPSKYFYLSNLILCQNNKKINYIFKA